MAESVCPKCGRETVWVSPPGYFVCQHCSVSEPVREAERQARAVLAADDPPEFRLWKPWALDLADDVLALLADHDRLAGEAETYRAALEVYADPRNWGISRDDLNHRVVSWIGPGAEKAGMPDALETARAALSDSKEAGG